MDRLRDTVLTVEDRVSSRSLMGPRVRVVKSRDLILVKTGGPLGSPPKRLSRRHPSTRLETG